jgi:hypothetical protein
MENQRILYLGCKRPDSNEKGKIYYSSRIYLNGKVLVGQKGSGSYDGSAFGRDVTDTSSARLTKRLVQILSIEEENIEIRGDSCFEPLSGNLSEEETTRLREYILGN